MVQKVASINVSLAESNSTDSVAVEPKAKITISDLTLNEAKIDIIDSDIVVTNEANNAKVVFNSLALLLFEEEESPEIYFDDELIETHVLLSKIGEVGNLSVQDFIAISSIMRDSFQSLEKAESESEAKAEAAAEAEAEAQQQQEVLVVLQQAVKTQQEQAQSKSEHTFEFEDEGNQTRRSIDDEGTFLEPAEAVSQATSSAITFGLEEAPPVPDDIALFDLNLLQLARSSSSEIRDGVETTIVRGGGGSEASVFDSSNEAQFSTETINFSTSTDNLYVESDNSDFFGVTTMSRVIQVSPQFPVGFAIDKLELTGLPDDFVIEGATKSGNTWTLEEFEVNERGAVDINLSYPVPSEGDFSVNFKVTSRFDEETEDADGNPIEAPPETILISEDSQLFTIRNVFGPQDLNFVNQSGEDVWVLANNPNHNRVFTGLGDDTIVGAVGKDTVQSGAGNDHISGAGDDDFLDGAEGDDTLVGGVGNDTLVGGAGSDTADYADLSEVITADLSVETNGFSEIRVGENGPLTEIDSSREVENILAGTADDTLIGNSSDNRLDGGAGNDLLAGNGGMDTLIGGSGTDVVDYSSETKAIDADMRLALDNVVIDSGNIDTLIGIEDLIGSDFDDRIIGSDGENAIFGGLGNDSLSGGRGNDELDGGEGDHDVADFSDAVVGVSVNLGEAKDSNGFTTAVMGAEVDRLRNLEDISGSSFADTIVGDDGEQILLGKDGDDSIDGAGGNDSLDGGLGNDLLEGGLGEDTVNASVGSDVFDGGGDVDTIDYSRLAEAGSIAVTLSGAGNAEVILNGDAANADGNNDQLRNVENIIATEGADRLFGDDQDNVLEGLGNDDVLSGGAGDDTLRGGEGRDSADYSLASNGVNIDLSSGIVANDGDGGRDELDGIEDLTGSDHQDTLIGNEEDNVLSGGLEDDILAGRGGDDLLQGGDGSDTASYEFAERAVEIDLSTGQSTIDGDGGLDTYNSIENLSGSTFDDLLIGDDLPAGNVLSGIEGDDTLNGGDGPDTLDGGKGSDLLQASVGGNVYDGGDDAGDTLDYSGLAGAQSVNLTLTASVDATSTVDMGGSSLIDTVRNVENVIGTDGDDTIGGDFLGNDIRGGLGSDTILGGAGSDTLRGGDDALGIDQLRFDDLQGDGVTLSLLSNTASYAADSSVDQFSGFETYASSNQDDLIYSGLGDDIVESLRGEDTFKAGEGNDSLSGGDDADTIDYSDFVGVDSISVTLDGANEATVTVDNGTPGDRSDDDTISLIENVIGSRGDDTLNGEAVELITNVLDGHDGNDTLDGGAGDDSLYGGSNDDLLLGGDGNDYYDGGTQIDTVDYQAGATTGVSVDLSGNNGSDGRGGIDELWNIENVTGTDHADSLIGDHRQNVLLGGNEADTIRGGGGADTLDGGNDSAIDEVRFDDLTGAGIVLNIEDGTARFLGDATIDTLSNFELYYATNQGDILIGSSVQDTIFGLGGNDNFIGSGGDVLDGGAGSDTISYSTLAAANFITVTLNENIATSVSFGGGLADDSITEIENVIGSQGNDSINGDALANELNGGLGNDTIRGGGGSDRLVGGAGNDDLRFDDLSGTGITLNLGVGGLGAGTAFFGGDSSTDTFDEFEQYFLSNQDDVTNSSAGVDIVFGLSGDDLFNTSEGLDVFDGGLGVDTVDYSTLASGGPLNVTLQGAGPATSQINGVDKDTLSEIENVTGTTSADTITGDGEANILRGLGGEDILSGGANADQLFGGTDNDTLRGDAGNDTLFGGAGRDTADYTNAGSGITVDMTAVIPGATADGDSGQDTFDSIENVTGSSSADRITGDSAANELRGEQGNDVIFGGGGSDTLDGGTNTVAGPENDVLRFDDLDNTGVVLNLAASTADYASDGSQDTFNNFEEYFTTNQADQLIGSSGADVVNLLDGEDNIAGSEGADTLDGGDDRDTIDYSQSLASAITVTLQGSAPGLIDRTGTANDDTVTNIENVIGTDGADTFTGDLENNEFQGLNGIDTFNASAGRDTLIGGNQVDTANYENLLGVQNIQAILQGAGSGAVLVTGGGGDTDTIREIENIVATSGADVLIGDDEANTFWGRGNDDTLFGGANNDVLFGEVGDDNLRGGLGDDTLDGGALGSDTADYSLAGAAVTADLGLGRAVNDGDLISGTTFGEDTFVDIENLSGSRFDDTLSGGSGRNIISGEVGADVLRGGGDNDTLDGGAGVDDVADYRSVGSRIVVDLGNEEASNDGDLASDTLLNIEHVWGSANDDEITGNLESNELLGNEGNDTLAGGAAADTLNGGSDVGDGDIDFADYSAGGAVTVNLGDGLATEDGFGRIDTLIEIEGVIGSSGDDLLTGDANNNVLDGADGFDTLIGAGGQDTLIGGNDIDTADYSDAANAVNVDLDVGGGLGAAIDDGDNSSDQLQTIENVIGSDNNDTIVGSGQENVLEGGDGNDDLYGAAGNDTLRGGDQAGTVDTANYSQAGTGVTVDLSIERALQDGDGGVDVLEGIENVVGTGEDDLIRGDANANVLDGGNRSDTLEGGGGIDTLRGGNHSDTASYENSNTRVEVDMVLGRTSDDGDGASDFLIDIENIIGSDGDDLIYGDNNVGGNLLEGGLGADILRGRGGQDTLDGGTGASRDIADYSEAGAIIVDLGAGQAFQDGDGSSDDLININDVIGSDQGDVITGDSSVNILRGEDGSDVLAGLQGADTLIGGDHAGTVDTASYSSLSLVNGVNVDLSNLRANDDGFGFVDRLEGIENVLGSRHADTIQGGAGANLIEGELEDDVLLASGNASLTDRDTLDGGAGEDVADYSGLAGVTSIAIAFDDTIVGGSQATTVAVNGTDKDILIDVENITTGASNDAIRGNGEDNRISAGAGDDTVWGGGGSDFLDGGTETTADQLRFDDLGGVGVVLDLVNGQASYSADGSTDTYVNFEEYYLTNQADTILGSSGADEVYSLGGEDVFRASEGRDTLDGGNQADTIDFRTLTTASFINLVLNGTAPATVLVDNNVAHADNDTLTNIENVIGTTGADTITGDTFNNRIEGFDGNDTLSGGDGQDTLLGGEGADEFLHSNGANRFEGGNGIDTINYSSLGGANPIRVQLNGAGDSAVTVIGGDSDTVAEVENVIGTAGSDFLQGDGAANRLEGLAGNDTFIGGAGGDTLDGGVGTDWADYSDPLPGVDHIEVTLNGAGSTEVTVVGGSNDILIDIENLVGSTGGDLLIGDDRVNDLDGGDGADTLVGAVGQDSLRGGTGVDTADYSREVDIDSISVTLNGGSEADVNVNRTVGADEVDKVYAIENVIGTAGNDTIFGDAQQNTLEGRAGDDTIRGGLGSDTLDGGADNNTLSYEDFSAGVTTDMNIVTSGFFSVAVNGDVADQATNFRDVIGSAGNDDITGDAQDNTITGNAGTDSLDGGDGNDSLLGGNEADTLIGGVGNDTLRGGNAEDRLDGGDGDDLYQGESGWDRLVASAGNDTLDGGGGTDTADYSYLNASSDSITVDLDGGTDADVLVNADPDETDTIRFVERVIGSAGDDSLTGDGQVNYFWAGDGADTLSGADGSENHLFGQDGDDLFLGSSAANEFDGGNDIDTIDYQNQANLASVSVTLGEGTDTASVILAGVGGSSVADDTAIDIENIIGSEDGDDELTGNSEDNEITALLGDDVIAGRGGNDTLDGGGGIEDTVSYEDAASEGVIVDLLAGEATQDGDLGQDTLSGFEHVTGSDFGDSITGSGDANDIHGLDGDDTIVASLGADEIDGGAQTNGDWLDYSDAAFTSIQIELNGGTPEEVTVNGGGVDNDVVHDIENVIGTGGNDSITGDGSVNVFDAGAGDDTLRGGEGNDTLDGGTGDNTLSYDYTISPITVDMSSAVSGVFTVAVAGSETDTVSNIIHLDGSLGADSITGDAQDNILRGLDRNDTIRGGAGNDTLEGGGDHDDLDGGDGNDSISGGSGWDWMRDSLGADSYSGGGSFDTIDYRAHSSATSIELRLDASATPTTVTVNGGLGADDDQITGIERVYATAGDDTLTGATGANNVLWGMDGSDSFVAVGGNDGVYGGTGTNDSLDYSSVASGLSVNMNILSVDAWNQTSYTITIGGTETDRVNGMETITGTTGNDTFWIAPNMEINGDDGNDQLYSYGANVTMNGGAGTDTIHVRGTHANNVIDAGADNDVVKFFGGGNTAEGGTETDRITYDETTRAIVLDLEDSGDTTVIVSGVTNDTISGFENITGSRSQDSITGNNIANLINGHLGNDTIFASTGADTLVGGNSNLDADTVDYSSFSAANSITVTLSGNTAATVAIAGGLDAQTISQIENVVGSAGNDSITGDVNGNVIDGSGGDDTVFGSLGSDTLDGGAHVTADVLSYQGITDTMTLDLANGLATVNTAGINTSFFSNFEQYIASNQADTISGSAGADSVSGADGNDIFNASSGLDTLDGGNQNDTLSYEALGGITNISVNLGDNGAPTTVTVVDGDDDSISNIENITGSAGNDIISGNNLVNVLDGALGSDTLDGAGGADTLRGQAGDDVFIGSTGGDTLEGGANNDTVDYSGLAGAGLNSIEVTLDGGNEVDVTLNGLADDDRISAIENVIGSSGADQITGDTLANVLSGGGQNDTLIGAAGADTLEGGSGNDSVTGGTGSDDIIAGAGNDTIDGGDDIDTLDYSSYGASISVQLSEGTPANVSVGGALEDIVSNVENIIGTAGTDSIGGDDRVNVLEGGENNDTLSGGGGNDTLAGGNGFDRVDYTGAGGPVTVNLSITGAGPQTTDDGDSGQDWLTSIEHVTGSGNNDTITGSSIANNLVGGGGSDTFFATAGDDQYSGQGGSDTIDYSLAGVGPITVQLTTTTDATVSISGEAYSHTLNDIENVTGTSGADDIRGDGAINTIIAGAGNDTVVGGAGADTLDGGGDTDLIDYSSVFTGAVDVDLGNNRANDDGTGAIDTLTGFENVIGTFQADSIIGNGFDNLIVGGFGGDTIDGAGGIDTVSYDGAIGSVNVNLSAPGANAFDGTGTDSLSNIEIVIGSGNNDTLTGAATATTLQGGDGADSVTGGAANDLLEGDAGADTLIGAAGVDTLDGGDDASTADTADYSTTSGSNGVEVNLVAGAASEDGYGSNDVLIDIQNVIGSGFDDEIIGNGQDNLINSGAGNDTLTGGAGADTLIGGAGNHTVDGGTGSDDIQLASGTNTITASAGNDTVQGGTGVDTVNYSGFSSLSVNLNNGTGAVATVDGGAANNDTLSNIEHVIGTSGADSISGDASANTLTGNAGDDTLDGEGAADNLIGGAGNDTLLGGTGNDTLQGGADNDQLDGGAGDDLIQLNSGINTVLGSTGNDTVQGGSGVDTVDYAALSSVSVTIAESGTYTATIGGGGADDDTLSGIENISGTGGTDTLVGNSSANVLDGAGGNDTLNGGGGDDTLRGGLGDDSFIGGTGGDQIDGGTAGSDTVDYSAFSALSVNLVDSGPATAGLNGGAAASQSLTEIENIIGTSGADNISGNASANELIGGAASDSLVGENGDDTLEGGAGEDTLNGGANNDSLSGGADNDLFIGSTGTDTINGDGGVNTINYSALSSLAVTLADSGPVTATLNGGGANNDSLENIQNIIGSSGADTIVGNSSANEFTGGTGNDTLQGGGGQDTLVGGIGNDTLEGDAANDSLAGGGGADILQGGAGNDTLNGGANADMADYSQAGGPVTVDLSQADAANRALNDGESGSDTLISIEDVFGSGQGDTITGDTNDNFIDGALGDDTIHSSTGSDTLDGGFGTDDVDYSSSAAIAGGSFTVGSLDGVSGNIDVGADSTTVDNFENFSLSANDDTLTFDMDALASIGSVDANNGSDTMAVTDSLSGDNLTDAGIDGAQLATIFSDVEVLDFTGTSVDSGSDDFSIGNEDIANMTDGGNSLRIEIDGSMDITDDFAFLDQGSAAVQSNTLNGTGDTRTIIWDNNVELIISTV
ncbi:MAG: hypothetical protein AB8B48_17735 [Pseudomonadales bacterium]